MTCIAAALDFLQYILYSITNVPLKIYIFSSLNRLPVTDKSKGLTLSFFALKEIPIHSQIFSLKLSELDSPLFFHASSHGDSEHSVNCSIHCYFKAIHAIGKA